MAKEIDFDQLFARWGQPDERPCDDWFDAFFDAMRESGRLVAKHEWCGAYAGSNNIWLFKGAYFAENEAHMYGPFDTFWDAADAVDFDKVTDATTSIWVDKDIDMKGQSRPEYALPTKSPTASFPASSTVSNLPRRTSICGENSLEVRHVGRISRLEDGNYVRRRTSQFMSEGTFSAHSLAKFVFERRKELSLEGALKTFRDAGWDEVVAALEKVAIDPEEIRTSQEEAAKSQAARKSTAVDFAKFYQEWVQTNEGRYPTKADQEYWAARAFVWNRGNYGANEDDVSIRRLHQAASNVLVVWKDFGSDVSG